MRLLRPSRQEDGLLGKSILKQSFKRIIKQKPAVIGRGFSIHIIKENIRVYLVTVQRLSGRYPLLYPRQKLQRVFRDHDGVMLFHISFHRR